MMANRILADWNPVLGKVLSLASHGMLYCQSLLVASWQFSIHWSGTKDTKCPFPSRRKKVLFKYSNSDLTLWTSCTICDTIASNWHQFLPTKERSKFCESENYTRSKWDCKTFLTSSNKEKKLVKRGPRCCVRPQLGKNNITNWDIVLRFSISKIH